MRVTESHLLALPGETLAEDDAEWMPGKSRTRLTPELDNGFLMDAPATSAGVSYGCPAKLRRRVGPDEFSRNQKTHPVCFTYARK